MRILLNGLPVLPRGGGLQNLRNLWREIGADGRGHRWLAVTRPGQELEPLTTAGWQELRSLEPGGTLRRLRLDHATLPDLARAWGADVVFTPMGAGPRVPGRASVMGWHDSPSAYPDSPLWARMDRRERAFEALRHAYGRAVLRTADVICVQTATMARRLGRVWGLARNRFHVVPNGPSAFLADEPPAAERPPGPPWRVLVIGEAKPPKNLEVVPWVAAALPGRGLPDAEILMTLPDAPGPWTGPVDRAQRDAPAGVPVRRMGRVPHERLGDLYRSVHAVLLPSLAESFSATYVEAMHFGVPLVTSDLDFARDICGDAAAYADPLDPEALAAAVVRAVRDDGLRRRLRKAGFRRKAGFPGWPERTDAYVAACAAAAGRGQVRFSAR